MFLMPWPSQSATFIPPGHRIASGWLRGKLQPKLQLWHNLLLRLSEANTKINLNPKWENVSRSPILFAIGWMFLFGLPIRAATPAKVIFSLDFPNSNPEHYSISVQSDGQARYESSGKISADSDDRDSFQTDFVLSDATRARIFDLAAQAHYFSGKVDSGKKIAFTGAKKLSYQDAQRSLSVEYNYSTVPAVAQLTTLFQSVAASLEFGHRLSYFHRYQKLALDDELKRMEEDVRDGNLLELQAIKPVLQEIYDDSSVMNVVRARARRIMEMAPPQSAAK